MKHALCGTNSVEQSYSDGRIRISHGSLDCKKSGIAKQRFIFRVISCAETGQTVCEGEKVKVRVNGQIFRVKIVRFFSDQTFSFIINGEEYFAEFSEIIH